jgi:hypothetical protein
MKKTLLIVLICLLLLSPHALAEERMNYGSFWLSRQVPWRTAYVVGFQAGIAHASAMLTMQYPEKEFIDRFWIDLDLEFAPAILVPVVTSLYEDPANSFIAPEEMLYIARDKLRGEDIDNKLTIMRKNAERFYESRKK